MLYSLAHAVLELSRPLLGRQPWELTWEASRASRSTPYHPARRSASSAASVCHRLMNGALLTLFTVSLRNL